MDIILLRPPVAPFLYPVFQLMTECQCDRLVVMAAPHQSLVPLHQAGQVFEVVEYEFMMDWTQALREAMALTTSNRVLVIDPQLQFENLDFGLLSETTADVTWVSVVSSQAGEVVVDSKSIQDLRPRFSGYMMVCPERTTLPTAACFFVSRDVWVQTGGINPVFCDIRISALEWMERLSQLGYQVRHFDEGYCREYPTFLWDLSTSKHLEDQVVLVDQYSLTWKRLTVFRFFCFHFLGLVMILLSFRVRHFRAIMKAVLRLIMVRPKLC